MAEGEVNITTFDDAGTLDGTEKIYLVRGSTDYKTTPNAIVAAEASARALGDTAQSFTAVVLTNPFTAGKAPRRIGDFAVNTTSGEIWQSTAITNAAASWNCISAGYYNGRIITNWDTHTQSGDITSYSTATGAPTSTESFYGHHINSNAGTANAFQFAIGYTTLKMYFRAKTASTWGAWELQPSTAYVEAIKENVDSINVDKLGDVHAKSIDMDELPKVCGFPMYIISTTAPDVSPDFISQHWIDTVAKKVYVAVGVSSAQDFVVLN